MTTQIVHLNGKFMPIEDARVPVLDRGFIFGDGVYEVIPAYAREPFALDGHLERLEASMAGIGLSNPHTRAQWAKLVGEVIAKNEPQDQAVYLQVTRGVAPRDHAFPEGVAPTVFIMSGPLKPVPAEQVENGVPAIALADNRWLRCNLKTTSLLANVLLRQAAVEAGAAECVLFRDGFLTEGSASNIFAVRAGKVLAPPKSNLILPGITYDVVLELAREGGIPVEVRPVPEAEARSADELWLSSSSKEVLAITTLDGKAVGNGRPGPIFQKVHALFQARKPRARAPAQVVGA
ncbi:MAG: D-amino acid aminotransferase [Burkholderiales bacterium]|nr:D-amino acid aminotransferase [Burkholderiales bacterium]